MAIYEKACAIVRNRRAQIDVNFRRQLLLNDYPLACLPARPDRTAGATAQTPPASPAGGPLEPALEDWVPCECRYSELCGRRCSQMARAHWQPRICWPCYNSDARNPWCACRCEGCDFDIDSQAPRATRRRCEGVADSVGSTSVHPMDCTIASSRLFNRGCR